VLHAPKGSDLARGDVKSARSALKIILDLPFEFDSQWSVPGPDGRPLCKLGDVPGNRVDTRMVKAFVRKLKLSSKHKRVLEVSKDPETGKEIRRIVSVETDEPLSAGYRNRIVAILRTLIKYRYEESSPTLKIETEKGRKRTGCFQGEAHLTAFLEHTPPWFRKVAWLAVDRGCMRLKEALYLEKSEVRLDADGGPRIVLPAHRVKGGKKKGKGRSFPISDANAEMLRAQMASSTSPIYVFAKPNGKPYSTTYVQDIMINASRESGVTIGRNGEEPCFHTFRRTAVTWRLAKARFHRGGNPAAELKSAQEEGGWDDIKILQGYLDETDGMAAESARMANISVDDVMRERLAELEAARAATPLPQPSAPTTPTQAPGVRRSPKRSASKKASGRAARRR
jgi:integrase